MIYAVIILFIAVVVLIRDVANQGNINKELASHLDQHKMQIDKLYYKIEDLQSRLK